MSDGHDFVREKRTVGFLTDPTLCIGCKACEVACKEWNGVPDDGFRWSGQSYDHTGELGASSWRHVMFLEEPRRRGRQVAEDSGGDPLRWVFVSDVCKHCEHAGCLEACPTAAIVRTETGGVYVQDDVCNGCGYCVVWCPFGVIDRRSAPQPGSGGAFKCTFCYDRQRGGLEPACAKACPTDSIRFGPLDELREAAARRVETLRRRDFADARLYDPRESSVGGVHALFLLLGDPERHGLPERPEVPTIRLRGAWLSALATSAGILTAALAAFAFV